MLKQTLGELYKAMAGSGGEVVVKLRIADALQGKRILLLPTEGMGMDIKTTNINELLSAFAANGSAAQK